MQAPCLEKLAASEAVYLASTVRGWNLSSFEGIVAWLCSKY